MTLFYLMIDSKKKILQWVRAGHEPAIFYDPQTGVFEELSGPGVGLGVIEDFVYRQNVKTGFEKGQIILLGTDGVWEAGNPLGEMFGKKRIYDILRENARLGAGEILERILNQLTDFRQDVRIEDDITLIIVKL